MLSKNSLFSRNILLYYFSFTVNRGYLNYNSATLGSFGNRNEPSGSAKKPKRGKCDI